MFKKSVLCVLFIVIVLSSCWKNSPYKGYTETDSGLNYKLLAIGDGKNKPAAGDYLQLNITYKTDKDSVFLDTYSANETGMVILPFNHSSFEGSFEEGLTTMNEGDNVSFIVNADLLFKNFFKSDLPLFLKPGSIVKMDVKLNKILNETQYKNLVEKYKEILEDRDIEEQRKLQTFLDTNQVQFSPLENGMFYIPIKQGTGDFAEVGDAVKINYKGFFLNGSQFESTYSRNQPLEFTLGEEGQVIKGFESAISLMNEGAKTKFIIPSRLAFEKEGSSTGIIPPYTTVVYEIELIHLTKHNN
jgi:FKBP-type peptidyl-prolyl cis-trans isomerase